jgi:hypothetical protein
VNTASDAPPPKRRGRPPASEQAAAGPATQEKKPRGRRPRAAAPVASVAGEPSPSLAQDEPATPDTPPEAKRRRGGRPRKAQAPATAPASSASTATASAPLGFTLYIGCKPSSGATALDDLLRPFARATLLAAPADALDSLEGSIARWYGDLALAALRAGALNASGGIYCAGDGRDYVAAEVLRAFAAQVVQA